MSVTSSLRYQGRENRAQVLASDNVASYTVEGTFSGAVAATLGINGLIGVASNGDIPVAVNGAFTVVVEGVAWKNDKSEARAFRRVFLVHRNAAAAPTIVSGIAEAVTTGTLTAWTVAVVAGSDATNTIRVQFTADAGDDGFATAVVRVIGR